MEKQKMPKIYYFLIVTGIVTIIAGLVISIIGFADTFSSISEREGAMPELFYLTFIGLPMVGAGGFLLGYARYMRIRKYAMMFYSDVKEVQQSQLRVNQKIIDNEYVFCTKCGTKLDEKTKKCQNCDK